MQGDLDFDGIFAPSLAHAEPKSQMMTFQGIELTNLYISVVLWAASALNFSIFRHSSTLVFAACLGVPPFVSALINLLLCGGGATHYPHLATWPLGGLSLMGILWIVRETVRRAQAQPPYLRVVSSVSRKSVDVLAVCSAIGLLFSIQSLTHATSSSDEGAATVQHSSLDYLLFVVKQARQSVRLNLMLEFLVQFTLASLFWAYFVVEQRKAHSSSSSAEGKDQAPRASSSEKPVTSPSEPRTRERARSRDDGGVEETGEAADKRRNGKDKNGLNRSSDSERDKDSSTSEAKQQDGAKTSDKPRGRRAGSALRTLFLRSLVLHSVVTCSIIFYAFCTWPFSDSWPYYLTFISPLFLMSLAPSVSLGIIATALLGEVFIFYESKRQELQQLLSLFKKQRSDNEALRTTNTFSQEKYDAVSRKITDKQKFLDHSFGEMKSRAEAMSGLISSLSDSDLPLEQRGYVSKLDETNTQLTTFVRDVSIFTKANDGLIDLEAQPFEVESLLESLITQLSLSPSLLGEKDIDITYQIADDVPRYLIGGATQLKNILESILWNAVKFTHQGAIVISVVRNQVRGRQPLGPEQADLDGTATLSFAISDTGIGIPQSHMGKLFLPFSSSTLKRYGGSGLGLSIAERLTSLFLDGRISVESEEGRGSTFTFTAKFSLDYHHPPPESVVVSLAGFPIYVIDDNEHVCRQITDHLSQFGCHVSYALNWRQGIEELKRGDYKLLFLDYMMGGVTGVEVHRYLMEEAGLRDLLVIMMCTPAQKKEIQHISPTLNAFLLKPLRKKELLNIVMNHSGSKRGGYALEVPTNSNQAEGESKVAEEERAMGQPLGGIQLKVLVAEDNKMSAKILDMLIKKAGHQCTVASDGQQAFAAYSKTPFDIIFMDCRMPITDGWEATKLIREKERKEAEEKGLSAEEAAADHVPIVALTADDSREMCLQVGMDDYLSKPVDKAAFYEMLQRYAHQKQQRIRSNMLNQRRTSRSDSLNQLPEADRNRQSIRILLVEDNATNALIGARVLRRKNFQVDIAQNGKIALDMFRSNPDLYKLILMDIHMPVMDGVTCTRHIREYENAQNIQNKVPIIALTADTTPRQRRICIEAGCNEYLSKPINYPLLVDTVKRFLQNLL